MTRDRLRFDPPRLPGSPDLRWALLRAFAPPSHPAPPPASPASALDLARRLDVLGRIASRQPAALLASELGPEGRDAALEHRRQVAAGALRVLRTAGQVAGVAAAAGIPVAFLKGAALHLGRHVAVAARAVSDCDVLAPSDRAEDLQRVLQAAGFVPREATRSAHHLAPLGRGDDPWVEVHREVPGCIEPGTDGPPTFQALQAAGRLLPADAPGGPFLLPAPPVLAAHALVHGMEDHGFGADRYPPFRMPCDLADLLGPRAADPAARLEVSVRVGPEVSPVEATAVLDLVAKLVAGDVPGPGDTSPAGRLLAHWVAGALQPDYRDALRIRQLAFLLRNRPLRVLHDKLSHRLPDVAPSPGAARARSVLSLLARLVRADLRIRLRGWLGREG